MKSITNRNARCGIYEDNGLTMNEFIEMEF